MSDYETPAVVEQRALAYAKQRAAEQAGAYVETYTRMEKSAGDRGQGNSNRAIIFHHKKDYSKAIKDYTHAIRDYNQAISLNPKFGYAYNMRGLAYQMFGDYDKAIADHKRALEINPNSESACNNLQLAYDNKRKHGYFY